MLQNFLAVPPCKPWFKSWSHPPSLHACVHYLPTNWKVMENSTGFPTQKVQGISAQDQEKWKVQAWQSQWSKISWNFMWQLPLNTPNPQTKPHATLSNYMQVHLHYHHTWHAHLCMHVSIHSIHCNWKEAKVWRQAGTSFLHYLLWLISAEEGRTFHAAASGCVR